MIIRFTDQNKNMLKSYQKLQNTRNNSVTDFYEIRKQFHGD